MKLKFIVSLLPYILLIILKLRCTLSILKQNNYNSKNKYINFLNNNYKKVLFDYSLLFIIVFFGIFTKNNLIIMTLFIACCMINSLLINHDIAKNKTNGMNKKDKIIFIIMLFLYLIPTLIMIIIFKESALLWYYFVLGLLMYINYFYILIANIICKGVENNA